MISEAGNFYKLRTTFALTFPPGQLGFCSNYQTLKLLITLWGKLISLPKHITTKWCGNLIQI